MGGMTAAVGAGLAAVWTLTLSAAIDRLDHLDAA